MRWRPAVPAAVLLLGFGLRMINLHSRPLWYDEAFTLLYARLSLARMLYGTADVHPLLYYTLVHGWMRIVGESPFAVRFFSVVVGLLTVAVVWRLASLCVGRRTGATVGVLAAASPFHVAYSQEARMYALLGLAAVATAYGLLRALEVGSRVSPVKGRVADSGGERPQSHYVHVASAGHWKWWGLYVLGAAGTLYAHNLGAFTLLALHLVVIARAAWREFLRPLALADLVVLGLFGPWMVYMLPRQLDVVGRGYWITPPGLAELLRAFMLPVLTFYEPAPMWVLGTGLFVSLMILVLLVLHARRGRSRAGWFLLLSWVPILTLMAVSQWVPVYLERALLPAALFYLVAVGWLLSSGAVPSALRWGLTIVLMATVGGSLVNHYRYVGFPRPPFEQATAYLESHMPVDDVVVHTSKLTYLPMHAYAPELNAEFLADPPGSPQDTLARPTQEALGISATSGITQAVDGVDRVWLVIFEQEIAELGEEPLPLRWLRTHWEQIEQERFHDLSIVIFERGSR